MSDGVEGALGGSLVACGWSVVAEPLGCLDGLGQVLPDEVSGLLNCDAEDLEDRGNGGRAGGSFEMGWIGPVPPAGDLDRVLGVPAALLDVRGMTVRPGHMATPTLVTNQM